MPAASGTTTTPVLLFSPTGFSSYSTGHDSPESTITVSRDGASFEIKGKAWKKYPFAYKLTANTILTFTVTASAANQILAIGLDNDSASDNPARLFQIGGSEIGKPGFIPITPVFQPGEGSATYVIPIGTYYTGDMRYLTFVAQDGSKTGADVTFSDIQLEEQPPAYDVVVYEGTPAGVMAAFSAAKHGHSVLLIEMNNHVGGVVSGGLTATDYINLGYVGGLASDFLHRVTVYYRKEGADEESACLGGTRFEPHVAEIIFDHMLEEYHVKVVKNLRLDLRHPNSVVVGANGNVVSVSVEDLAHGGYKTFTGKVFIDASYEGDLMAGAHVTYTYGREAISQYNESLAGIRIPGPDFGKADKLIMSYNYRVNLTSNIHNRVLIPKPANYEPKLFINDGRSKDIREGKVTQFAQFFVQGTGRQGPNTDYDVNWFDFPGSSLGYADGDWTTRETLAAKMRDRVLSELYVYQNEVQGPNDAFHTEVQNWGLPKDEFTDTDHFPFQFYVREARRMVGEYVLTQADLTQNTSKSDGVCYGTYPVDCHIIQDVRVNGVGVQDFTPKIFPPPYEIPYRSLTPSPKPGQPGNLLVPVCLSASHVAYCSVRIELQFMMLGHAAGDAAHLALLHKVPVQQVNTTELRSVLSSEYGIP